MRQKRGRYDALLEQLERTGEDLISLIDPDNVASQGVARRVGETKGERWSIQTGGKDYPVDIWQITRGEWLQRISKG